MNDKLCSNCIHNKYNYKDKLYYCDNVHSDNYGVPTFYDDSCVDFEDEGTPLMDSLCKEGDICNQFEDKSKYVCLQMDKQDCTNIVMSISEAMANLAERLAENN